VRPPLFIDARWPGGVERTGGGEVVLLSCTHNREGGRQGRS
jgi:hypothetical protein